MARATPKHVIRNSFVYSFDWFSRQRDDDDAAAAADDDTSSHTRATPQT